MKRWDNLGAVALALFGIMGFLYWQTTSEQNVLEALKAEPVDHWFTVRSVTIPDFTVGTDPLIQYDRQIRQPFNGTWNVEIHPVGGEADYALCNGSGISFYEPKETLPKAGVTLSWFVGKECKLPEGQYIAQMHWEIRPVDVPTKILQISSNNFHVTAK
jgi:hypothetical protein